MMISHSYLYDLVPLINRDITRYYLSYRDNFALFHVRSEHEHSYKSFFSAAVVHWNALPIFIQQAPTISHFVSSLKTYEFY